MVLIIFNCYSILNGASYIVGRHQNPEKDMNRRAPFLPFPVPILYIQYAYPATLDDKLYCTQRTSMVSQKPLSCLSSSLEKEKGSNVSKNVTKP